MSKQLNLITFTNENVDNKYIQFEQQMAPRIQYEPAQFLNGTHMLNP